MATDILMPEDKMAFLSLCLMQKEVGLAAKSNLNTKNGTTSSQAPDAGWNTGYVAYTEITPGKSSRKKGMVYKHRRNGWVATIANLPAI